MSKKLKEIRTAAGLSQSKLAEASGVNVRTIQHYEQGSKNLDHAKIDTLLKLSLALNCKLIDLIENEEYVKLIEKAKIK